MSANSKSKTPGRKRKKLDSGTVSRLETLARQGKSADEIRRMLPDANISRATISRRIREVRGPTRLRQVPAQNAKPSPPAREPIAQTDALLDEIASKHVSADELDGILQELSAVAREARKVGNGPLHTAALRLRLQA